MHAATDPTTPANEAARKDFRRRIDGLGMTPLWSVLGALITPTPASACRPHLWQPGPLRRQHAADRLRGPPAGVADLQLSLRPLARSARAGMRRQDEWDPCHGLKLRYIDPRSGDFAMPTIAPFLQLLPAGFRTTGYRATDATVFTPIEGRLADAHNARSRAPLHER